MRTFKLKDCTSATAVFDTRTYMLEYGKGEYSAKFVSKANGETAAETSEITYQYTYDGSLITPPKATGLTYSDGNFAWSANTADIADWQVKLYAVMGVWKKEWITDLGNYRANAQTSYAADTDWLFEEFDAFLEEYDKDSKNYYSLYASVQAIPKDITTHTFSPESDMIPIPRIAENNSVLPTEFKWSETTPGVVEFTAVPGVEKYSYVTLGTHKDEYGGGMGGGISSAWVTVDASGKGTVDLRWDILVNYDEGEHNEFYFVKIENNNVVEYSIPLEYNYTPSPTQQALPKPTGLKYENSVLSWSEPDNDVLLYDIDFYAVCGDSVQRLNGGVTVTTNLIDNDDDWFFDDFFDDYFEEHTELDKSEYSLYATVTAFPKDIINYWKSLESEKILIPHAEGSGTDVNPPASTKHKLTYKVFDKIYKEYELNKDEKIVTPSEDPSVEGYIFNGWEGIPTDGIMPDRNVVITAKMTLLTTIKGKVIYKGAPAVGAKITVPNAIDAVTDENGNFSIADYPCGSFVANVEYNGMKTTVNVKAFSAEKDLGEIEVKEFGTSAVIAAPEVRSVTITDTNALLSDEDRTFLETVGNTIIIETKANNADSNTAIQNEASTKYSNYTVGGIFLDLTVSKVKSDAPSNPVAVTETNDLIAFEIEIPQAIQNKSEYIVLREHNGTIDVITSTPNADGEYLTVSGNVLTLYVKKFSVYSLYGKDADPVRYSGGGSRVSAYTVKFETNGGSKIESVKVDKNKTVAEPTAPTKDGFEFAGWYADKALTTKYDFGTKVTKGITLYAAWTEKKTEFKDENTESADSENKITFTDVKENDWFCENVKYVFENGLMNGTTDTEFAPNENLTRAMLVAILYRAEGEPETNKSIPFADVKADDYFANAVIWAQQNGIVSGVSETEFAPDVNITREQIATIIYRYAVYKGYDVSVAKDTNILSYEDFGDISEYAVEAVQYAVGAGIIEGKTASTLNPKDFATRAEIAAILQRFIEANK